MASKVTNDSHKCNWKEWVECILESMETGEKTAFGIMSKNTGFISNEDLLLSAGYTEMDKCEFKPFSLFCNEQSWCFSVQTNNNSNNENENWFKFYFLKSHYAAKKAMICLCNVDTQLF